ncbi:MAG: lamin tail domain-containing protein [Bacilli bacterium]|jgi:hypothetical protein
MTKSRLAFSAILLTSVFLAGCQSSEPDTSVEESSTVSVSETTSTTSTAPSSDDSSLSESSSSSEESSSSESSSQEPLPQEPDLFFSEYIEGPNYNKALELYNPTDATIDLSQYTVKAFFNGSPIETEITAKKTLSGTLAAGETFVFYNSQIADTSLLGALDAIPDARKWAGFYDEDTGGSQIANFNGNDAVGLFKNDVLIDVFGVIGNAPSKSWSLTYASGTGGTENVVMTRIPSVDRPSVNSITLTSIEYPYAFDPLEWNVVAYTAVPATHTIGTHTSD